MPGLLETDSFSGTDITSSTLVASYTAASDGMVGGQLRLSGLNTSAQQTITIALVVNDGTNDFPGVDGGDTKSASGDTRYVRELPGTVWLDSGDTLKVYVLSSASGDTSVAGSVRFRDAGNPVEAVTKADLLEAIPLVVRDVDEVTAPAPDASLPSVSLVNSKAVIGDVLRPYGSDELMKVIQMAGNTAAVERGWMGTTPEAVAVGTLIEIFAPRVELADDTLTAAKFDESTAYPLASADTGATAVARPGDAMALTTNERTSVATAVWAATTRTLSSFGTLVADIWASATRTLTGTVSADVVSISGDGTAADNLESACDGVGYNLGGGSIVAASVAGSIGSTQSFDNSGQTTALPVSVPGTVSGTVNDSSPGDTTFTAASGLSTIDDAYNGQVLKFTSGNLANLRPGLIQDYDGATRRFTLDAALPATPSDGDSFIVIGLVR